MWAGAIQASGPGVLLLVYLDLSIPKPALIDPSPLHLWTFTGGNSVDIPLSGTGFASTMYLDLGTQKLLVKATNPTVATFSYAGFGDNYIPPGRYTGRLVVPSNPTIASDTFSVIAENLPPLPTANRIPAGVKTLYLAGNEVSIDRDRRILYTLTYAADYQWTLAAFSLSDGTQLRSASFSRRGAALIFGFQLTRDGRFLYLADDLCRIQRFRADSLEKDLEFTFAQDAPPHLGNNPAFQIMVFEDAPESLLVATPAGRLIVYDRDQPRYYGSADFPSRMVAQMQPLVATSNFIYAMPRPNAQGLNPCVVRYAVDWFGLQPPEELCDPAVQWGRHPEMVRFLRQIVLEAGQTAVGLRNAPDPFGSPVAPAFYDTARDLVFEEAQGRLVVEQLSTGEVTGFFPALRTLTSPNPYVTTLSDPAMVSVFILDDNTIVVVTSAAPVSQPGTAKTVTVEQGWRMDILP